MPSDPPPVGAHGSSAASPGQGARRERLARLYDELGDVEKLGLSQFAEDLSNETQGPSPAQATTRFPPVPGRWGDDCVLFEFQDGSRRISCSVSRQALEEAGPGRRARRWQLMEAFERLCPHIERIAWKRFAAAPGATGVIEILVAELTAELDDGPEPAAPAAALRGSVGE